MSAPVPIPFRWDGESMTPRPGYARRADQCFVIGQDYVLAPVEERSLASHNHFFASIAEAWKNLPPEGAERFPTADHLRKYALIKTGFHEERSIVCGSKAEAPRVAAFLKPIDDYAVITVRDAVVTVYTAKSQSAKAMGKEAFQASKDAVLDFVAGLIGVTPDELQNARAA